jgi:hypothetical protein
MGMWATIKGLFTKDKRGPLEARRLNATSHSALARALKWLPAGEPGWITLAEARDLFSHKDAQHAFGEIDAEGRTRLATFAATSAWRSELEFTPKEGRVYFRRR